MRRTWIVMALLVGFALVLAVGSAPAYAAKKLKQDAHRHELSTAPAPIQNGTILTVDACGQPCCEHKCCQLRDRKCRHRCAPPPCQPCIEYKGCPAPCSVEKVVTVTNPKTCCTVELVVQVPACGCEKMDRERDGDLELDYGKYEVKVSWHDGGRRLVVRYDD